MQGFNFPSIAQGDKFGYVVDNDMSGGLWDSWYHNGDALASWAGKFQTFGDGMCKHSPTVCVQMGDAADYLFSLAKHCLGTQHNNEGPVLYISGSWRCVPSDEIIMFAAGLRYEADAAKRVYVNILDCKKSTQDSKQHDKRWMELPSYADGSLIGIVKLLAQHAHDGEFLKQQRLRQLGVLIRARELLSERLQRYMSWDAVDLGIPANTVLVGCENGYQTKDALEVAYKAVDGIVKARHLLWDAERFVARYVEANTKVKEEVVA